MMLKTLHSKDTVFNIAYGDWTILGQENTTYDLLVKRLK